MAHKIAMYPDLFPVPSSAEAGTDAHHTPADAPPSYDVAMGSSGSHQQQQQPTAPVVTPAVIAHPPGVVTYPAHIRQPPPQSQTQPGHGQVNTVSNVIVDQPGMNVPLKFGPRPCRVHCPNCGETSKSRMEFQANTRTHIVALLLCLVGCCCCACFIPYCVNSFKTGNHYCKRCNTFLGTNTVK